MTVGVTLLWIYIGLSLVRAVFAMRKPGGKRAALAALTSAALVLPFALGVLPMIYVLVALTISWLIDAAPEANHRPTVAR